MTWSATYAKASEDRPNERYISYRQSNQNVFVDLRDPGFPLANLINPADNLNIGLMRFLKTMTTQKMRISMQE